MMKKAFGSPKKKRGATSQTPSGKSRRVSPDRGSGPDKPDDWPLTPAQIREIDRRVADLDNPVRYLLVSRIGTRFAFYYNISDDLYAMNDPGGATLFKRRKAAESVKRTLGRGGRGIQLVECRTTQRNGARVPVLSSADKRPKKR
jgi:hypothetical protein